MIGCRMTVDEVLAEALKDRIFYDDSGGGVTFSGGEPLDQPAFLLALLQACRRQGLHTAVDTSGYAAEEDLLAIAVLTDLFLYDLKVIDDRRHREWTGVSNKLILKNLQALGQAHARIWIRVPIIPGCNDDREQLQAIARVAASIPGVVQLNLLPYHPAGIHKRASLGQPQPPPAVGPVAAESLAQAAQSLRLPGLSIQIGG
jgi:pyruvate formate lyase activating enzyme